MGDFPSKGSQFRTTLPSKLLLEFFEEEIFIDLDLLTLVGFLAGIRQQWQPITAHENNGNYTSLHGQP